MIAHISLTDLGAGAGLVALAGGQIVAIIQARHNRSRIIEVHERVVNVQEQIKAPSSDQKTIGSLTEDIAQSFHLMAELFADQTRKTKKHQDQQEERWAIEGPPKRQDDVR